MAAMTARFPRARLLVLLVLASGCVHRASLRSTPSGALVRVKGEEAPRGNTPIVLEEPWRPLRPMVVQVSMAEYRTVEVELKRRWLRPKLTHEVVMVRRHQKSGLWEPEEAKP